MSQAEARPWWSEPARFFQHLLREEDAIGLDPARLVDEVRSVGANATIAMGGGFSAWYPTTLNWQQANPHLEGDFLGQLINAARRREVRVIVRMDISKGRAAWLDRDPDWFSHRPDGGPQLIWDMPQVCATGPLWQEGCFAILDEILDRYEVDGFFFNYFAVGRCWCARCESQVREATGAATPAPGERRPVYERWRQATLAAYTHRLNAFIKARQPGAALIPYHHVRDGWDYRAMAEASDIVSAQVSNPVAVNPVDPQPQWNHWAAEEASAARSVKPHSAPLLIQSASAFFASRQTAMPAGRLISNLAQAAASGATTCPALNGMMATDDPRNIPALVEFGRTQETAASWYQGLTSVARVAVVRSADSVAWGPDGGRIAGDPARPGHVAEFRGAIEMLSNLRRPTDIVPAGGLRESDLARYDAVILPALSCLDDADADAIDAYVRAGGLVVATADLGASDADGEPRDTPALKAAPFLPGASRPVSGAYFGLGPEWRAAFGGLPHLGADGEFWSPVPAAALPAGADLRLIGPFRNNAPEFTIVRGPGAAPGLIPFAAGKGRIAWLPWRIGALYHAYALPDYARVLDRLLAPMAGEPPLQTDAPTAVQFVLQRHRDGLVLHLINIAAPQGKPLIDITPIAGFTVRVRSAARRLEPISGAKPLAFRREGAEAVFEIDRLESFAAIALVEAGSNDDGALSAWRTD